MTAAAGADRSVVVVGAGVAGIAAASALASAGKRVALLERRAFVGGRAYSYRHPALEEVVDSQHVMVGCCVNLIDLCRRTGIDGKVRWYDRQVFLEPADSHSASPTPRGVRASEIAASALPAPMQYAPSFLAAKMLGLRDKLAIARGLAGFARGNVGRDDESAAAWYRRTGQTECAVRHFWEPLLLATLNDEAANCSMKYAGQVFYELFLRNAKGGRLGIPTVPLSEFYGAAVDTLPSQGVEVRLGTSVEQVVQREDGRWLLRCGAGEVVADDVVLAVPFEQTQRLVRGIVLHGADGEAVRTELLARLARFVHSPFISILLWFDREITHLDHAWLLDSTIQWFFHKSRIRRYPAARGSYVELVIAGSRRELGMSREEILRPALDELARFFPEVRRARLVKSGILKEARATFSVLPGMDAVRPGQRTGWAGLYLAGDWTATGWPSTMEGAARSGRLAAGEIVGQRQRFLAPELPATGLMQWLERH
jgi:zeta-carotene desaturase